MRAQFDTNLVNSTMLWLDNKLLVGGEAYVNRSARLLPQYDPSRAQYSFASPYQGWVYDSCATGAAIPSGFYTSSGQFLTRASGLTLDFNNGRVLSSGNWGSLSGSFASKEYNVYYSQEEVVPLYIEALYGANQNISYTQTGAPPYGFAAPCIIFTNAYATNDPAQFGGQQVSKRTLRLYAINNNSFNKEALNTLITDCAKTYYPMVTPADTPLGFYGDLKTGYYSYCDLQARYGCRDVFIKAVYGYKVPDTVNQNTYFTVSTFDLEVEVYRYRGE